VVEQEPEVVFPEQEYPSDVEIWLEGRDVVLMRVGSFGPTVELSPEEARGLGLALQELADKAAPPDA
jgi:hypothetical protein